MPKTTAPFAKDMKDRREEARRTAPHTSAGNISCRRSATGSFAKGVLTVTLPKSAEAKKNEKKIAVKAA